MSCTARRPANGVELLPGVRALLEDLDRAGFRQAIGSSAPRANLELILRLTGVEPFFPAVVAMEDTQRGKPDPQVFQVAARAVSGSRRSAAWCWRTPWPACRRRRPAA